MHQLQSSNRPKHTQHTTGDDNAKQLAVSIDKHFQEWAELGIKAVKEGAELPPRPDYSQIIQMAKQLLNGGNQ